MQVACRKRLSIIWADLTSPTADLIPVCFNTSMIDPRKATKGRRMSKETRKKSTKPPARKTTHAAKPASTTRTHSTPRKATAAKSSNNSKNKQTEASSKRPAKPSQRKATSKETLAIRPALTEGATAPAFKLPSDSGTAVSLADYAGKKLVVFFYPRANTPGCTREAIDFTRLSSAFTDAETAILGVSGDSLKAQESFRNKHQLSVPLLSDEKHDMLEAYGAWGKKSMYGKEFQGILRTTILIGADGKIIKVWRNVRVDGHAEEVLAAAQMA
jgi:thioredoxin-dependent peroxiredoxin